MREKRSSGLDLPLLLSLGAALVLLLVAVVLFLQAGWRQLEREERAVKRVELPFAEREAYEREQRELLEGYGWQDREGGLLRIPVERAMELVVTTDGEGTGR